MYEKKHKMHKSVKNAFFIFFLNCVLAFCGNMKIILISIQQKKEKSLQFKICSEEYFM